MSKEAPPRRFGPERWITVTGTGEHVQVEMWSSIMTAYRVHSRKRGTFLVGEGEVQDLAPHPEAARGKYWNRCPAVGCGAPLTPELEVCASCGALTCACGRCRCPSGRATAVKKARKKAAAAS